MVLHLYDQIIQFELQIKVTTMIWVVNSHQPPLSLEPFNSDHKTLLLVKLLFFTEKPTLSSGLNQVWEKLDWTDNCYRALA